MPMNVFSEYHWSIFSVKCEAICSPSGQDGLSRGHGDALQRPIFEM